MISWRVFLKKFFYKMPKTMVLTYKKRATLQGRSMMGAEGVITPGAYLGGTKSQSPPYPP